MVTSKCPVSNCVGFCWKNVWHWVVLLALLPFALQGVKAVVGAVSGVAGVTIAEKDSK
jgi:hypothetical protein